MKKKILRRCFKPLSRINQWIKKNEKLIFFYSNLGFRDNVKAFYDYLIEQGYNDEYRIVVSIIEYERHQKEAPHNVKFISNKRGIITFMRAKYAFYCYGKYPIKPSKDQKVINLWHGMPLKKIGNMERGNEEIDYNYFTKIVSTSKYFIPILMKSFRCQDTQVMITGQPKTDIMFREDKAMDELIRNKSEKVILWMPTYRDEERTYPLPVITPAQAERLDRILEMNKIRLIVKLHPLQRLYGIIRTLPHINWVTQIELDQKNIPLYALLRVADALITDYSSVYFDYMMLDRPIGFTLDDIEEYQKTRGFVVDKPLECMPGRRISTYQDLLQFVDDVIEGNDPFKEERREMNQQFNQYTDGENSRRVAEMVFGR